MITYIKLVGPLLNVNCNRDYSDKATNAFTYTAIENQSEHCSVRIILRLQEKKNRGKN